MVEERIQNAFVKEMKEVLSDRYYSYENHAVTTIIKRACEAKSNLIDLFSKHPLWNPEKLMIQFDTDMEREIDVTRIEAFVGWLRNQVNGYYSYTLPEQKKEWKICTYISNFHTQFFDETMKDTIDRINELNENFKLRTNMKASKAIGKICKEEGWDKLPDYNRKYAELCDALSPIKVTRHTCISVNPIDFLLMSNGNSWHSCHDIGTSDDAGCYSSGTISYMLDNHSFLFYTVDGSYNGNSIELEEKIQRQVFGYNDEVIAQLRLYPQSNDSGAERIYDDIRAIVQKVISDCLGKPNLWIKSKNDVEDVVSHGCGATCYPDWESGNPGASHCSISTLKERENGKDGREIIFGTYPICIECGSLHSEENYISCCSNGDCEYCHECGNRVSEDDEYWVGDYCYCENCVTYCEDCQEYVPNSEINNIDGRDVCDSCLYHSGNYIECNDCGEYHHYDDMVFTDEGNHYCSDCEDANTFSCHGCGVIHDRENEFYDEETDQYYCEDCYNELIEEREEREKELEEIY